MKKAESRNKIRYGSDSTSSEEWVESGNSDDDIDVIPGEDIKMYPLNSIKPGSFILVKFKVSGKRSSITQKYVASVLREILKGEYEIHCLKSLNREKNRVRVY